MKKLMQLSKNRQELFDNTIKHFNRNNRGFEPNKGYRYRTSTGLGCAIGREISDKLAEELDGETNGVAITNNSQFKKLPKRLQNMGKDFLFSLQLLHDSDACWDNDKISESGILRAKRIAENYKLRTSVFEKPF